MSFATVHVAVFDSLADWEIGHLTAHLRNGRHQRRPGRFGVTTVGLTSAPITTMGGLQLAPDTTLDALTPAASAMLVLPGGEGWEAGALAPFVTAARQFLDAGVPVAAICGATFALAAAGLLDDRRHTSNADVYLQASGYRGGAHFVDEAAVTDGDLITASGVRPVDFARAVFARLDLYEPRILHAWYRLYANADAAAFYELMSA